MEDLRVKYEEIQQSFKSYKLDAEEQMKMLIKENMRLERDINSLVNIVEISKFVNLYFADEELISLINDMIIGVLGVSYSTIYLVEDGSVNIKATNIKKEDVYLTEIEEFNLNSGDDFRVNHIEGIKKYNSCKDSVKSIMGISIKLSGKYLGYIIVEHIVSHYLDENSELFLKSISNQIGIAIENSILYKRLQDASKIDPLLGIKNRKYFFEKVEKTIEGNINPYAIVMVDLDNFKRCNDTYGHQFGDEVLIQTTKLIRNELSEEEGVFARYGGEELIIFLSDCSDKKYIFNKIDSIRQKISSNYINYENIKATITASFGLAFYEGDNQPLYEVIKEADKLLYKAKNSGKNKVIIKE